jgi:protein-S-isoprenylcysteine O-methyltransferase Ste14
MSEWYAPAIKFLKSPPKRSFFLFPLLVLLWELLVRNGRLALEPYYLVLMVWGYGQFKAVRRYRKQVAPGIPGPERIADRLITTGIYRYTRNPMYLGHIIFLAGLALTLQSILGALVAAGTAIWFHYRVLEDERRLLENYGDACRTYMEQVKRWIPGVF